MYFFVRPHLILSTRRGPDVGFNQKIIGFDPSGKRGERKGSILDEGCPHGQFLSAFTLVNDQTDQRLRSLRRRRDPCPVPSLLFILVSRFVFAAHGPFPNAPLPLVAKVFTVFQARPPPRPSGRLNSPFNRLPIAIISMRSARCLNDSPSGKSPWDLRFVSATTRQRSSLGKKWPGPRSP